MNFYIGQEYKKYNIKFEAVRDYYIKNEKPMKGSGSRAECCRWMIDRIFKLVKEKMEEKK